MESIIRTVTIRGRESVSERGRDAGVRKKQGNQCDCDSDVVYDDDARMRGINTLL